MEFKGTVTDVENLTNDTYIRFRYVIEEDKLEYPAGVIVTTFGEKAPKLNIGDKGTAFINLKLSKPNSEGKRYGNLDLWKWIPDEKKDEPAY